MELGRRQARRRSPGVLLALSGLAICLVLLYSMSRGWTQTEPSDLGTPSEPESLEPPVEEVLPSPPTDAELAEMQVNELGKVMIIMYHDVTATEGDWARSRENFQKDLQRFDQAGYSLILLSDYLTGNIDVPEGRSPLVFTFDDGTRGQLALAEDDGVLTADPSSAVGIMLDYSKEHPEFGHAATFFVNSVNPFGGALGQGQAVQFLLDNGMEVGNHTIGHENLSSASPEEVRYQIGRLASDMEKTVGYEMVSLALPYGGYPKSKENLLSGEWEGHQYVNLGVMLVGAEPAPSPFSAKLNPSAIPRIQGSSAELDKWIDNYERYPGGRFVSDGCPDTVTVRLGDEASLDPDRIGERETRIYDPSITQ